MPFSETGFPGLLLFEPTVFEDARGYFFESFNQRVFDDRGISKPFLQDNQSRSSFGVIRGLHYQVPPYAQSKLVRVLSGSILDVVVDIRKGSPTYGKTYTIELSASNKKQLYIPVGFAHGFSVLTETAEVMYKCDEYYNRAAERGILYSCTTLNIDWNIPGANRIISEKDQNNPGFQELNSEFNFN
ncbi:MAG TPA: dTDP-4-dehydrorhamnose 3,5-epimerase [Flavitalea sp.]|nr:dTDP-4-dehydrorhamnose 3,5-epimerase [Flavitalea sp.]